MLCCLKRKEKKIGLQWWTDRRTNHILVLLFISGTSGKSWSVIKPSLSLTNVLFISFATRDNDTNDFGVQERRTRTTGCKRSGAPCNALHTVPLSYHFFPHPSPPPHHSCCCLSGWVLTPKSPAVCALPSSVSVFYDCYLCLVVRSM